MNSVNAPDTCLCPMCWHPVRGTGRGLVWSTFAASLDIDMDIDIEPSRTEVVAGD